MDEMNTNVELEEESLEMVDEQSNMSNDELKNAIEEQMSNLRRQSILVGAQTACNVILQKIYTAHAKPGKKSYRDLERLIIDIQKFCETGVSRKINTDGTTSSVEESAE
jgi:hypothetical protein